MVRKQKKKVALVEKCFKWKGLRTIFSPSTNNQVLDSVEE
jgi:hypothetical protein